MHIQLAMGASEGASMAMAPPGQTFCSTIAKICFADKMQTNKFNS